MKTHHPPAASSGFTLMETLVAIVLLAIAATVIISLNGQLFRQWTIQRGLQQGTQLQQACIEQVLGQRQSASDVTTSSFNCTALNNLGTGYTLSVGDAAAVQYCPTGLQCRQLEISVSGQGIAPKAATLLLVNH